MLKRASSNNPRTYPYKDNLDIHACEEDKVEGISAFIEDFVTSFHKRYISNVDITPYGYYISNVDINTLSIINLVTMKIFTTIFLLLFSIHFIYGADNYKEGDTLYVWANSGLNLRSSPAKDSKLIETLEPGTQLTVVDITNNEFVYKLYPSSNYEKHPYLLYGNWVKVISGSGKEGFVFDSFLLDIPIEPNLDYESYLESISYKIDTSESKNQYTQPYKRGTCQYEIAYEYYRTEKYGSVIISLIPVQNDIKD